jgi:hypothetical protein
MPVTAAVAEGLYGDWAPDGDELARLEAIFPEGVCDYDLPSVGRPGVAIADAPQVTASGTRIQVSGAHPRTEVQLRSGGEVVETATTNPQGRVTFASLEAGAYTVVQVVDGQRSLFSEGVTIHPPRERGQRGG